jgi:drug/metabolite transporter superfamily protein YnfA
MNTLHPRSIAPALCVAVAATQSSPVILTGLGAVALAVVGVVLPAVWSRNSGRRTAAFRVLTHLTDSSR